MERPSKMRIVTRHKGHIIQICIPTYGCKIGNCIFCNYGASSLQPLDEMTTQLEFVLQSLPSNITTAVIDAVGSMWDEREIPRDYLIEICKRLNKTEQLKTIVFETHYKTITDGVCHLVRELIPTKNIDVEVGLETINENSQRIIRKPINLDDLKERLQLLPKYDIEAEANVFFGIPNLTKEERREDCIQTILWACSNGFRNCVIFPCNVKKGTDLYDLYLECKYIPVNHHEVLEMLLELSKVSDKDSLNILDFSWTGDWTQVINGQTISEKPLVCDKQTKTQPVMLTQLENLWQQFYIDFAASRDRKTLIEDYERRYKNIFRK
jgi:hypothetical protein